MLGEGSRRLTGALWVADGAISDASVRLAGSFSGTNAGALGRSRDATWQGQGAGLGYRVFVRLGRCAAPGSPYIARSRAATRTYRGRVVLKRARAPPGCCPRRRSPRRRPQAFCSSTARHRLRTHLRPLTSWRASGRGFPLAGVVESWTRQLSQLSRIQLHRKAHSLTARAQRRCATVLAAARQRRRRSPHETFRCPARAETVSIKQRNSKSL